LVPYGNRDKDLYSKYKDAIEAASEAYSIDPLWIKQVIWVESRFHPFAVSEAEAAGFTGPSVVVRTTRQELVRRVLEKNRLLSGIADQHDLEIYSYSTPRPRRVDALDELKADGAVTATGDALATLLADPELQARPAASVVLIGDGRTNVGVDALDVARAVGANQQTPIQSRYSTFKVSI